jgi:hypothetical protein
MVEDPVLVGASGMVTVGKSMVESAVAVDGVDCRRIICLLSSCLSAVCPYLRLMLWNDSFQEIGDIVSFTTRCSSNTSISSILSGKN